MSLEDRELAAATTEAAAVLVAVKPGELDTPVPSCPGWVVGDVMGHLSRVHGWAAKLVEAAPGEKVPWDGTWPSGPATKTLMASAQAQSEAALKASDPDRVVFTWAGKQPARWWLRRLAHETTLHAWDVTAALGRPLALDPRISADGIDELFEVFLSRPDRFDPAAMGGTGETWHLHATDVEADDAVGGEWQLRFDPEGVAVTREHAKGDLATRGAAGDLYLLASGRTGPDTVEAFGDTAILDRYRAASSF